MVTRKRKLAQKADPAAPASFRNACPGGTSGCHTPTQAACSPPLGPSACAPGPRSRHGMSLLIENVLLALLQQGFLMLMPSPRVLLVLLVLLVLTWETGGHNVELTIEDR